MKLKQVLPLLSSKQVRDILLRKKEKIKRKIPDTLNGHADNGPKATQLSL